MEQDKIVAISELQKAYIGAVNTDEPVAVELPTGGEVNGDPALMGMSGLEDYVLTLYLPIPQEGIPEGKREVMNGSFYEDFLTVKERTITPKIARRLRHHVSIVAVAFTKFETNGETSLYEIEDLMEVYKRFDDEVITACEEIVKQVLGLNDTVIEYLVDTSLLAVVTDIIKKNQAFFQID